MATVTVKGSMRSGKLKAKKHNRRDFDLTKSTDDHIKAEQMNFNIYWTYQDGSYLHYERAEHKTFEEFERDYYKERYKAFIDSQNATKAKNRMSKSRYLTVEKMTNCVTYCPTETLLEIGNKAARYNYTELQNGTILYQAAEKYIQYIESTYKGIKCLDFALHGDEPGSGLHIHSDWVYESVDKNGNVYPCIDACLKDNGIELPNPEEPKGRYNNRKMSFDAVVRQKWYDIIEETCKQNEFDLKIDRVVTTPSKKRENSLNYACRQAQNELDSIKAAIQGANSTLDKQFENIDENANIIKNQKKIIEENDGVIEEQKEIFNEIPGFAEAFAEKEQEIVENHRNSKSRDDDGPER